MMMMIDYLNKSKEAKTNKIFVQKITAEMSVILQIAENIYPELCAFPAQNTPPPLNPLVGNALSVSKTVFSSKAVNVVFSQECLNDLNMSIFCTAVNSHQSWATFSGLYSFSEVSCN